MAANETDVERGDDGGAIEMQEKVMDEDEINVKFIHPNHKEKEHGKLKSAQVEFTGLTKEELMKFSNDPFWKKVRVALFILFWIVWVGMLIGAILVIVFTPKCPKRPNLEFWQKKTAYWLDPFTFKDTDGDGVGDIKGIIKKLDYLKKDLNVGFLIIDPVYQGHFTNPSKYLGMTKDMKQIDEKLGSNDEFKNLVKKARKSGIEIVMVFNPNQISYEAFKNSTFGSGLNEVEKAKFFLKQSAVANDWLSRTGKTAWMQCDTQKVYSSLGYSENPECLMPDLNLTNPNVVKEIKSALQYWMEMGVQGFVFTDAAFYVENFTDTTKQAQVYNPDDDAYFKTKFVGQTYRPGTVEFLQEMRATLDEMKTKTDKPRVLLVESGNVGYGLEATDPALQFFGSEEKPAAHMVISYEFVRNRAWKIKLPEANKMWTMSRINNYINTTDVDRLKDVALTTATSSVLRQNSVADVAATFLLPGTPIVYYGSELGLVYNEADQAKNKDTLAQPMDLPVYPNNKRSVVYKPGAKTFLEMDLYNHLMMPWKPASEYNATFKAYVDAFGKPENVMAATAVGRGDTIFQLYEKLSKIREKPSLLWGTFKWIEDPIYNQVSGLIRQEIFERNAEGFPKYAVVIMEHEKDGKTVSLEKACEKAKPLVVYPPNSYLPLEKEVSTDTIYIKTKGAGAVYVFECVK